MYIYVFSSENKRLWKIGFSNDPDRRLKELQTGCPFKIEEYTRIECDDNYREVEKAIHEKLSPYKQRGGKEWYKVAKSWINTILFEVAVRL